MQLIICWGASGHAKVVAQTLRRLGRWRLEGFIDDRSPERRGEAFCGARVLGGREALTAARDKGSFLRASRTCGRTALRAGPAWAGA